MDESDSFCLLMDSTMDKVVKQIYNSCDIDNSNLVPVSLLVGFIKPFMPNNLSELEVLQSHLDPNNSNPCISSEVFYKGMSDWTAKIKDRDTNLTSDSLTTTETLTHEDEFSPVHSTPRASLEYKELVKNCSGILNMSNISVFESENSSATKSKIALDEHLMQLELQVKKTSEELDSAKQQLAMAEEQNETLATDLQIMTKQLRKEQQTIEQLKQDHKEEEEIRYELYNANKKIIQLEKSLAKVEKDRQDLLAEIEQLESKKSRLEGKLVNIQQQEQDVKKLMIGLQEELEIKDSEITSLKRITNELTNKLDDQNQLIIFYKNENELALHKIKSLEKSLKKKQTPKTDGSVSRTIQDRSPSSSGSDDGSDLVFNSPKLLNQLAHPVTPPVDNFKSVAPSKKTPMDLHKMVLLKNFSTPINPGSNSSRDQPNFSAFGDSLSLHDELSRVSDSFHTANSDLNDQDRKIEDLLQNIIDQESDKCNLWSTIKQLSDEIETLKKYRDDYQDLENEIAIKNTVIENLHDKLGQDFTDDIQDDLAKRRVRQFNYKKEYELLDAEIKTINEDNLIEMAKIEEKIRLLNEERAYFEAKCLELEKTALKCERVEAMSDEGHKGTKFEHKTNELERRNIGSNDETLKLLQDERAYFEAKCFALEEDGILISERLYGSDNVHEKLKSKCTQTELNPMREIEEIMEAECAYSETTCVELGKKVAEMQNNDCEKCKSKQKDQSLEEQLVHFEAKYFALEKEYTEMLLTKDASDKTHEEMMESLQNDFEEAKSKCIELEEKSMFLTQFKDSFDKLLEDNDVICENCDRIINDIVDRLEPHLNEQKSPNLTFSIGDFTKLLQRLQDLRDLVEIHMKADETKKNQAQIEDVCGFDSLKVPTNLCFVDPKKMNFNKQQLKIERLQERIDNMQKELEREKLTVSTLSSKISELKSVENGIIDQLQKSRNENENLERLQNNEIKIYEDQLTFFKTQNQILQKQISVLNDDLDLLNRHIAVEQQTNHSIRAQLEEVENKLKIQQELVEVLNNSLKQRKLQLKGGAMKIVDLQAKNSELEAQLGALHFNQRMLEDVHKFLINSYNDLERATSIILHCKESLADEDEISLNLVTLLKQMEMSETQFGTSVEKGMFKLSSQIKLAITLLEIVTRKCSNLAEVMEERSITSDTGNSSGSIAESPLDESSMLVNDTFNSCYSKLFSINEGDSDISQQQSFPSQTSGFLDDFDLDSDHSRWELAEKFEVLTLNFVVDFSTCKTRYEKQQRRCQYFTSKMTKYLDAAIELSKSRKNRKSVEARILLDVASYLEMFSGLLSNLLESSEQCGVLKCEMRTSKCWNFVTNYVASLRKDYHNPIRSAKKIGNFLIAFTGFSLIFVALFVLYVQVECSKFGQNAVCPVEWFFDRITEIRHDHNPTY